jgi:hypothetical protein
VPAPLRPHQIARIEALLRSGYSIRAVATAVDIHRETVRRYAQTRQPEKCSCGKPIRHRGNCSARYLRSQVHKEVLAKVAADFQEPPRRGRRQSANAVIRSRWPYCIEHNPGRGHALISAVDALVAKYLVDDIRADICQDLILHILEGNLEPSDLTEGIVNYASRKRINMFNERTTYRLDTLVGWDGDDGIKLLDIIPDDYDPILAKRSVRRKSAA